MKYSQQSELFMLIGKTIKKKIEAYIIGGSAMLYYNAKEATKDIDLVVTSKEDFDELERAMKSIGFSIKEPFLNKKYEGIKVNKPIFFVLGDRRVDMFLNEIICFKLSETMKARATELHEYANLTAKIISPEDIILLKCATERQGDRQDAKELISRYNIKWDLILKEAEQQSEAGKDLFVVYLYDFLEELKDDLKADISKEVLRNVRKTAEKAMVKVLKNKDFIKVTKFNQAK
jgi:hypothetical protein